MSAEEDFDAMYEQDPQQQQTSGGLHQLQQRHQQQSRGHGPIQQQQQQQKHRRPKAATPHVNNEIPSDYVCWSCVLRLAISQAPVFSLSSSRHAGGR